MSPDKSLQDLFNAALERQDAAERARFLDEACGADAALRERVEKLLHAADEVGGFMAQPSRKPAGINYNPAERVEIPPTEKPGDKIGRYKLLQQIGEGGCGVVYMAEQEEPVRRRVALKVIKLGMDTKQVIARFEAERQALAMMDHPNIARVLDAGATDSGRPFFVMELVRGTKITEFCDEKQLSTQERLDLFLQVCSAIQHAHQKGVIHRDVKPSNILVTMVDGLPVPKVIDFGIAKATNNQPLTDKTLFTAFEQFIGTPAYMSPEQAELSGVDIDTRTDIYSLGVLLYELLTGGPPFDQKKLLAAGLDGMRRIIRETEPAKPSTRLTQELVAADVRRRTSGAPDQSASSPRRLQELIQVVRGDLDWIAMKCLEKDRARRYETANALAVDIRRHLENEPVVARPPSIGYRLSKLIRRNKGPALAVSLILVAILAGTTVSVRQAVRANQQRRIAEANVRIALAAVAAEKIARESAEARETETRAVLEFLESKLLAAARPEGHPGGLGRDVTLRKALEVALLDESFRNQPLIEARLRLTLATTFANLGEAKIALEQAERSRAIRLAHLGAEHPDALLSTCVLAGCYQALGRRREALELLEKTLPGMQMKFGPEDPRTLSAMNNLALSYASLGRNNEALILHEQTLALLTARLGSNHVQTVGSMNNLALAYSGHRNAEALELGKKALALTRTHLGAEHPTTLQAMDTLAYIYQSGGNFVEAARRYEETLGLMKASFGPENPVTLSCMNSLAGTLARLGRNAEAVRVYEEALALREAKLGADHPDTLSTMDTMSRLLATCSDLAIRDANRALELAKRTVELSPRQRQYWNTLGIAYYQASDWQSSINALQKSMEIHNDGDAFDWLLLAMSHWQLGNQEEARRWYDRAIAGMRQSDLTNEGLTALRREAARLLGVTGK